MALHQLSLYAVESPRFLLHYRGTTPPPSTGPHFLPVSSRFHTISTNLKLSRIHLRRRSTAGVRRNGEQSGCRCSRGAYARGLVEYVGQIKRVLELLKQNRDILFGEDLREAERKRLLGIDDNEVTREDLVDALEDVNEGRIPKDCLALRLLAEEMLQWLNLEVEAKKSKRSKSLYAKATDTGVDLQVAVKRLNIDWDTAAEIDSEDNDDDETEASIIPMSNASYASDHIEEEEEEEDDDDDEPSSKSDNCYDYNCEYDDATSNNGGDGDDYYDDDEGDNDKSSVAGSLKSPQQEGASMKGNRSSSASRPGFIIINLPPPSPPPDGLKNTTAAATLPCSAASSPMPEMVMMNGSSHGSRGLKLHPLIKSLLHRQHSKAVTRATSKKDASFPRSKSCGDGRSSEPPDNFDMCSRCYVPHDSSKKANVGSEEDGQLQTGKKSFHGSDLNLKCFNGKTTRDDKKLAQEIGSRKFKCRAFCMFLPGISKGKHASTTRRIKEKREEDYESAAVSRIVSLEKFECGSFASSVRQKIEEEEEKEEQEQDRIDSYYDLPLEMITEEEKHTNSPVQAKFVFQKDRKGSKRSESKLTSKSSRHVRFLASTQATRPASPSKVGLSDDQLKKAREDLNGYLEAMV